MRKLLLVVALIATLILTVTPALAQDRPSIPDVLANDPQGRFTTLLAAVDMAGLSDMLSGEGPFTLLAPTNDGINATLESLGLGVSDLATNPDLLIQILSYHVIPERLFFRNIIGGLTTATVQGEEVTFAEGAGGRLAVNDVIISDVDNVASNGIVQVIEGVLVPPSILSTLREMGRPTVGEVLAADGRFTTLLAAVDATGLTDALNGDLEITVLAPTDEAFAAALSYLGMSAEDLLGDTELLSAVLRYHVLPGRISRSDLAGEMATLGGDAVTFEGRSPNLTVNGIDVAGGLGGGSNGVYYVIEGVLLPPALAESVAANRAHLRLAHLSPDAGAVDIYINDILIASNVTFGTVSEWMDVPAGAKNVQLVPAGGSLGLGAQIGRVQSGSWVTIAVTGVADADRLIQTYLVEDYSPLADDQARISVFHAIESAPAVDVLFNGTPLTINLAYPGTLGSNDGFDIRQVGAQSYAVAIVATGTTTPEILSGTLGVQSGMNYLVIAAGTPANPSLIVVATDVE